MIIENWELKIDLSRHRDLNFQFSILIFKYPIPNCQFHQYPSTIAHGYLTLSVLPYLWAQIIEVNNIKMLVNYGMDKMRFGQPVITGSRIRMTAKLHSIQNLRGICKVEIDFKIEIEGQRKPALEGISSFLYYFK